MAVASKPAPPARKVTTAAAAAAICERLAFEDQVASFNRANIHAGFDGAPPFDPALRKEQGLEELANINFLGMAAKRRDALAAYVDLTESVEFLAEFKIDWKDDNQRMDAEYELADKHKWLMGEWDFENRIMMLADGFIVDGISVALRNDPWDFRWDVATLMNFQLPRRTKVGEEHIKLCKFTDTMEVDDLYEKIKDPKAARKRGWNVGACQKAIAYADPLGVSSRSTWNNNWERFQLMVKENGYCGYSSYRGIDVHKLISKEADGRYSLLIIPAENSGIGSSEFLYKRYSRFEKIEHLITVFTSGVGDGTYHSIRSMGWDIFPYEQAMDRLNCKLLDGTALAGSIVAQPKDPNALENFQMQSVGGFMVVQGDVAFPSIQASNVATQVMPVLDALDRRLQNNTGRYQARAISPGQGGADRTKYEVQQQVAQENVLTTAEMILFYRPLRRLYREDVRRLFNPDLTAKDPGGKLAFEFRRKLMKAGVTKAMWSKIVDVRPVRAIGNGSPTQRIQAQDRLLSLSPQYDEAGRQAALYEATAVTPGVGFSNARRYVQPPGARPPQDVEIASNQNVSFAVGLPQPVLGTDNHWVHCTIHLDYLQKVANQVQAGEMALPVGVTTLNVGLEHCYLHYEPLSLDTGRQPEAKAVKQKMQQIGAIAQQQGQKLDKMQRDAMQQQQQPQESGGIDPAKMQELAFKEKEFEQGYRHKEELHALDLKTKDLVAAQEFAQKRLASLSTNGR